MNNEKWTVEDLVMLQQGDNLAKRLRAIRRLAEESMTLIDEKKEESALSNYNQLHHQFDNETMLYDTLELENYPVQITDYIRVISNLSNKLPSSAKASNNKELYQLHNEIYKAVNELL